MDYPLTDNKEAAVTSTTNPVQIQMDATTVAAATLPLWMPLRPRKQKVASLLRCHEFVCLEQLINCLILADEIVVPNFEILKNGAEFARRFICRDPGRGYWALTYGDEADGIVGKTLTPVLQANVLCSAQSLPEVVERLRPIVADIVRSPDFIEAIVDQIVDGRGVNVLCDLESIAGYSAPQNPFGHAFTDTIEWMDVVGQIEAQSHYKTAHERLWKTQPLLQCETLPWVAAFVLRGILYSESAKHLGIPYIPHPLRLPQFLAGIGYSAGRLERAFHAPINMVGAVRSTVLGYCVDPIRDYFDIELPPLLALVLQHAKLRSSVLPIALELRTSEIGVKLRELVRYSIDALARRDGKDLLKLSGELRRMAEALAAELGVIDRKVELSLGIVSPEVRVPNFLSRSLYSPTERTLGVVYDVVKGVTQITSTENDIMRLFTIPGEASDLKP